MALAVAQDIWVAQVEVEIHHRPILLKVTMEALILLETMVLVEVGLVGLVEILLDLPVLEALELHLPLQVPQ